MSILPPDPVFILRSDMNYVHSTCFLDSEKDFSRTLLAATESGYVYLWDVDRNKVKTKHQMGESIQAVYSVSSKILTQEKSGVLKVWIPSEAAYEISKTYNFYGGYCRTLLLDDNILLPQEKGTLDLVHLETTEAIRKFQPKEEHPGTVMCLEKVIFADKTYILVGYETGTVLLFDYSTGKICSEIKLKDYLTSISYDDYTRRAICGNSSNHLQIFQVNPGLEMTLKCEVSIVNEGCNVVKLRPDKKIFISGGWDHRIRIHSWKTLRVLVVLTPHKKPITDVQFSPYVVEQYNAHIMACSSADGGISLWNIYN